MFSRIMIGVFYAGVFFALGAWSGGSLKPIWTALKNGAASVEQRLVGGPEIATGPPAARDAPAVAAPVEQEPLRDIDDKETMDEPAGQPESDAAETPLEHGGIAEVERPAESVAEVEAPGEATPKAEPGLLSARRAFAEGDLQGAAAAYGAYLATHPEDARAYGELGNVYFNGGQTSEAANAFYAAALLLIADGKTDEARALEPAIRTGAPALASDLLRRLASSASAPEVVTVRETDS